MRESELNKNDLKNALKAIKALDLNEIKQLSENTCNEIAPSKLAQPGDILEISTALGLCYAQYTHFHLECGDLVRVLEGFYHESLNEREIEIISQNKPRFSVFICCDYCLGAEAIRKIGSFPVSDHAKEFPVFKKTNALMGQCWDNPESVVWQLWDGKSEWEVGLLTEDEKKKYPEILMCVSDTTFIYYIEN